ncbi:MAG: MarR family transcriptional regulator [Thermoanaerobacteraceae bacterium]|nr:MarR family transcriptional regulator [Thermoanaerobacteraceae bacterium]
MENEISVLETYLREISRIINLFTKNYLNKKGLTMSRFWVLNKLSLDNPITMSQLQKELLLSPGTLTGLIDNLVEDNLVKRWRDDNDRRLVFLLLTDKGYKLLEEILHYRSTLLSNIPAEKNIDITLLNNNLKEILSVLKTAHHDYEGE